MLTPPTRSSWMMAPSGRKVTGASAIFFGWWLVGWFGDEWLWVRGDVRGVGGIGDGGVEMGLVSPSFKIRPGSKQVEATWKHAASHFRCGQMGKWDELCCCT